MASLKDPIKKRLSRVISKLKIKTIRQLLEALQLKFNGLKHELAEKLLAHLVDLISREEFELYDSQIRAIKNIRDMEEPLGFFLFSSELELEYFFNSGTWKPNSPSENQALNVYLPDYTILTNLTAPFIQNVNCIEISVGYTYNLKKILKEKNIQENGINLEVLFLSVKQSNRNCLYNPNGHLLINGEMVALAVTPNAPVCVPDGANLNSECINFTVVFPCDPTERFIFNVVLCTKKTLDDIIQNIQKTHIISAEITQKLMLKNVFVDEADAKDDFKVSNFNLSLICPIGQIRIVNPGKGLKCNHIQCFDLGNFLSLYEPFSLIKIKPCPICGVSILFSSLHFDEYFSALLKNVPEEQDSVCIDSNGNWKPSQDDRDEYLDVIDLTKDEDDDDDIGQSGSNKKGKKSLTSSLPIKQESRTGNTLSSSAQNNNNGAISLSSDDEYDEADGGSSDGYDSYDSDAHNSQDMASTTSGLAANLATDANNGASSHVSLFNDPVDDDYDEDHGLISAFQNIPEEYLTDYSLITLPSISSFAAPATIGPQRTPTITPLPQQPADSDNNSYSLNLLLNFEDRIKNIINSTNSQTLTRQPGDGGCSDGAFSRSRHSPSPSQILSTLNSQRSSGSNNNNARAGAGNSRAGNSNRGRGNYRRNFNYDFRYYIPNRSLGADTQVSALNSRTSSNIPNSANGGRAPSQPTLFSYLSPI